ncbi:MAG: WG repeat-containing protein [Prevotellaceae bacterium]|jgi:serine/threonine protein kinase|nr:WG repeat-containing protein [Prevotellaceae bacterium]
MQLQDNTLFDKDRYRLIRLLGRGGFSEVWLAEDTKTGLKVALKIYAPGTGLDEDGVRLFSQEFSLVFNFNHGNLLRPSYYDVCERMPYLIMPFCERGSAHKSVGRITENEAWNFLRDVAAGLAYLHAQEPPVIHQDIKPDNVLIDANGQYLITDFGISARARSTLRKSAPKHNTSGGTIAYMAPERFGKDNTPIMASDVWALGATVYELLTGDTPFGEHGGLIQKSGADIPNINSGNYSEELKETVMRCLALEAWDRPTAKQLVEWSGQHLRGEKIQFKQTPNRPEKKDNKPKALKRILLSVAGGIAALFLILFVTGVLSSSDECYRTLRNKGIEACNAENFEEAKTCFEAILNGDSCAVTPSESSRNEIAGWITKCDEAIKEQEETRLKAKDKYDMVWYFVEGLALVKLNDKWGCIDKTGKEVIPVKYDDAFRFSEGFAAVELNDKLGYIDKTGTEVIPLKYDDAFWFAEGLAAVKLNDKWGYIDKTGTEVIPLKYNSAYSFSEGLAPVKLNDKWGCIDKTGTEVIPLKYDDAFRFSEGFAAVELNDKWGYIDKTGTEVIPLKYDDAFRFFEGLAAVKLNDKWGYIDKTGTEVIPLKYDDAFWFAEGLAAVKLNDKWGYIDKTGTEVIPFKYNNAYSPSEGLACVRLNDKWGYLDRTGKEVIPLKYDDAGVFSEGLAAVKLNGKWGFIDRTGKEVIPFKYSYVFDFSDGLAWVEFNGTYIYIDKTGTSVEGRP